MSLPGDDAQQSLFPPTGAAVLYFDGGSRGNPGLSGFGFVLEGVDGQPMAVGGEAIGTATNNVAEYRGLIAGLARALDLGVTRLTVHGDSKLVIEQMRGAWKVRAAGLQELHAEARGLARRFTEIRFAHVRRAGNAEADRLANVAMDAAEGKGAG